MINAQPVYADGVVFAGSETGRFAALDALTGLPLWTRTLTSVDTTCADVPQGIHGISATPVLDPARGTIWVAGGDGRVWALDTADRRDAPGLAGAVGRRNEHIWGALALRGRRLYVGTASYCNNALYRGRVVALNPETGQEASPVAAARPARPRRRCLGMGRRRRGPGER